MSISFSTYAAIVKNLRGILYFGRSQGIIALYAKWLGKRFKYRTVGLPPELRCIAEISGVKFPSNVVPLTYPNSKVKSLIEFLNPYTEAREALISTVFASMYVSPLIILGEDNLHDFSELEIHELVTTKKLTNADIKLHLRIADYTILDAFATYVKEAQQLWKRRDPNKLLEVRRTHALNEAKRFWRLTKASEDNGEPKVFLVFVDLIRFLTENELIDELVREFSFEDIGATLALVPAFVIPEYLISAK